MIPILITVKTLSQRCPGKNIALLGRTLQYIQDNAPEYEARIITDSDAFKETASEFNVVTDYWIEEGPLISNLHSECKYLNLPKNADIEHYIDMPVPQPCRDETLVSRAVRRFTEECKTVTDPENVLITSFTTTADRECFEITKSGFKIKDTRRTGSMCGTKAVADGAIYVTSKAFLNKCILSQDTNYAFWNESKISFVRNYAPLVDIDTVEELELFKKYFK